MQPGNGSTTPDTPRAEQEHARTILAHALERVLPEPALRRYVRLDPGANTLTVAGRDYHLSDYDRVLVVGGGKAARRTASELVSILGDRITAGVLNVYRDQAAEPVGANIALHAGDHPTPSPEGVAGARAMVELLRTADERTLVIALISGGGSSLMALPVEGVSLQDYEELSKLLLTVPATIDEINTVRKHIDPLKGGGMRKLADRAGAFVSLVLSDVPVTKTGIVDDPSVIASGPTVGDDSTFAGARQVLVDHGLWDRAPAAVRAWIEANVDRQDNETLPKTSALLAADRSQYVIIADNDQAMEAAGDACRQLGYITHLVGWNTGTTADKLKAEVTEEIERIWQVVTPHLAETDQLTFASFSTDGVDGRSDLAGAIADEGTLAAAAGRGLDHRDFLARYDSATFMKQLGLGIQTGPTGTNVADVTLVLVTNPNNARRKTAFVFGGEATVNVRAAGGREPGHGGRNTHLTLLAAERLARRRAAASLDGAAIKRGLVAAGIPEARIEIGAVPLLGYATDVGPISLTPLAVVGVREHADVERAVRFAHEQGVPITARGAGSGLPGQAVGAGIVLDMRSMDGMQVLTDHPSGGKVVLAQSGVICTRLNNFLKPYGVFLASYPASTDMATIGGMIANNASGANSLKLGTTQHQVLDLHVVLADGTGLWTSEIRSDEEPWQRILELVRRDADVIDRDFPRVPKNSSGYNVLDISQQLEAGLPVDWTRLFAHSEGTLGVITEARLRAVPLATQKATCIVYFTDLQEACRSIPPVYELGPSCFDTAVTTNLDLIRQTYPDLGIRSDAKIMYIIEFDDLEVEPHPTDPAGRIGRVGVLERQTGADLIARQVEALRALLEREYAESAVGFEVAYEPARQDALWQGRRGALQVLYAYDPAKRPLTMIECVVIPRDEGKLLDFIRTMEQVFSDEGVVAGTHGHAGDCNFHVYLLLDLTQQEDRRRLIEAMTKITEKVTELGGSMSGEHADGRTRGIILPYVFGRDLFDLFVAVKDLMDPRSTLHPGVKIIKEARDKDLHLAIEELVGIEARDSQLNLAKFRSFGELYCGVCSVCSQCADMCPVFQRLPDEFAARTEAAPTFKRALAIARETGGDPAAFDDDPRFREVFDLCLLCGQCTWKCATNASMRDMVAHVRHAHRSRHVVPAIAALMEHRTLYDMLIRTAGATQRLWDNGPVRRLLAAVPSRLMPSSMPAERYVPRLAGASVEARHRKLVGIPASEADIAYFYGCSSDLFAVPILDSFLAIAERNGWRVSLPPQRCCGEPFAALGNLEEHRALARYNIDQLADFQHVVTHCPSCKLAFAEYAKDFERIGDTVYAEKAHDLLERVSDPADYVMTVVGAEHLAPRPNNVPRKVAVHVSCHEKLGHKLTATRNYTADLLALVPGLEVVPMNGADECCGQGGPWGLVGHYDLSVELRRDKIASVTASEADVVTSWCMGCLIQMQDGLNRTDSRIQVRHPLELLGEAYQ